MATESASSLPRGKGKNGRKLVDFDEFIHAQFAKTRGSLRSVDVLSALAQWFTAALVFFFAVVMLDHWIIPGGLAVWTRWISLAVLVLGSAGYLAYAVGIPLMRRISLPFAARTIERSDPTLKNNLINFLDLRRRQEEFSPAVLELVEQQAATDLTHVEVENAVSREGLVKVSYVMLGMVVLGCAYVLLSPKSPFTTFGRVLAPAADISPPTKVTIAEVLPGDAQVFAGDELEVTAATGISDGITPDRMTLYYTTASRKYVDEPLDMVPVPDRPRHWRARLRGDSSRSAGLQEDFTYRLHAGDYTTRDYRINVIQAPSVRVEQVVYDFPQYTGFERRVLDVGDLDALEGTTVTLTATTNMPVKHGGVDFDGDLKTDLVMTRREDPERNGDSLEGKFVLGFKPDGTPRYERYQVLFETLDGETNPNPILYRIQTRRDYPPTVSIPQPGRDLSWPANTPLRLEIEAEDKDFALRRVILHVTQGRQSLAERDLGVGTDLGGTLSTVYNLDLAQFDLQAGDVIQYWAEALDNKEPQANRAESTRYEVRILSPLSPEEKEQLLADASDQIQQQPRQIEESQPDEEETPDEEPASGNENSERESDAKAIAKILEKLRQEHDGDEDGESDDQAGDESGDDSQSPQPNESRSDQQEPAGAQQKPSENGEDDSSDPDKEGSPQEDSSGLPSGIGKPQNQTQADDESSSAEEGGTGQAGESGSNDQPSEAPPGGSPSSDSDSDADPQSGTEGSEPSDDPSNADPKPGSSDQPGTESTQPSNSQQKSQRGGSEDDTGSDSSPSSDSEETGKGEGSTDSGTPKPGADPETPAQPGTEKPEDAVPQASDKPGESGDSATQNEPRESDPQSPSHQTDHSDKQSRDSGNAPSGGKPSPGQKAPQPGTGQEGSQEQGEQGGKPSDQQGSSDATRPGQQKPSDQPTGQGGSPQGPSETSDPDAKQTEGPQPSDLPESQDDKQPSDTSGKPMGDPQASDSSPNNSNSDQQGSPSDSSQSDGSANQQEGSGKGQSDSRDGGTPEGGKGQSGSGNQDPGNQDPQGDQSGNSSSQPGGGSGQGANQAAEGKSPSMPDPSNEDYAKKATELVLDFLRNHKKQDEIDPELAKELGRTPEQLKKLMQRLEKYQADAGKEPDSLSPEEAARLRAFEESVRRQRLKTSSFERSTTGTRTDPRAVFQGDRSQIPPEYREQFEAYLRSVSRNSKPKSGS